MFQCSSMMIHCNQINPCLQLFYSMTVIFSLIFITLLRTPKYVTQKYATVMGLFALEAIIRELLGQMTQIWQ